MKSGSSRWRVAARSILIIAICLQPSAFSSEEVSRRVESFNRQSWREAQPGYQYSFPRDHAAHEPYRIEWWYYTGNLTARDGRRFGYQLTFFRTGVVLIPENPSRWAVRDLYMAHFAISDIERESCH
jgi:predicted secreted hydrolase